MDTPKASMGETTRFCTLAAAETDAMMVVPSALTDFCRMMEPMAVMEN